MDVHMESPPPGRPAPIYPSAPTSPDYELPEILLTIPSGVVLYYIDKAGNVVTTLPSPTFLQIFRSPDYHELGSDDNPAAYLVVRNGEWSYPLIPRKSPVFLSKSGIYTFPDLAHEQQPQQQQPQQPQQQQPQQQHSVAIVLDSTVSEANRKVFKDILDGTSLLKREGDGGNGSGSNDGGQPEQQRSMTEAAVLKGAELIGKGIVIGAKAAEYGMQKGAEAAQKYMEPEPGKTIDPKVKKGIEYAKRGSEVTKYAAGKVEGWVGDATRSVGRSLAKIVFGKDDNSSSSPSGTMQQIKWILKLGLQGLGVVFSALEDAKNILKKSIKSETVKVVDYKYGPEAADVAGVAADAFGNLVDTADSAMGIGLSKKTFAKKIVKKTGKEMAREAVRSVETNRHDVAVIEDEEGRYVLADAPEAAPKVLERVRRDGDASLAAAPGSPERSRSPLPTSMTYSTLKEKAEAPPPRPATLPPTAAASSTTIPKTLQANGAAGAPASSSSSTRQGNARFTDDEVEALLALAPTPTHDTLHHALDLPQREPPQRQHSGGTTNLYPKI